jgi:hypothetical protein
MEQPVVNPGWRKSSHSNGAGSNCVEVGAWRKSSYSNGAGANCVEVGTATTGVLVRDTTNRASATLTIPAAAWRTLLARLRA